MQIKRDYYLKKLVASKGNKRVKVITGMRRVGKSFLLNTLFYQYLLREDGIKPDQILKISLDGISNIKYRNPLFLSEYIKENLRSDVMNYVFIDEIQFVERIENPYLAGDFIGFYEVLNELLQMDTVDVYVTGSNSKMLSKDVLTEFRGRGDPIHVMPLSLREIQNAFDKPYEELYRDYQIYGGLPYIFSLSSGTQKEEYLKNLFNETYLIDVIERNNIRNTTDLEKLTAVLASSIGSFTNPSKIEKTFKSELNSSYSREAIANHLEYLKEAFIISEANRYDIKGRKYIGSNSKYYYTDIGLRNAKLNFRQYEPTHIMENIIYNHLNMLGYNIDVGIVEVNEKKGSSYQKKQLEVDFIVNKGDVKFYIQSAYRMESEEKKNQEKSSLQKINDSFKKIIVINDSFKPHYDENGFLLISLKDFLLEKGEGKI